MISSCGWFFGDQKAGNKTKANHEEAQALAPCDSAGGCCTIDRSYTGGVLMSAEESKKIVLGFIEDLSHGNLDNVTAAFADDVTWWLPGSLPVSGTYTGKKEILEGFFGKAFPLL